MSDSSISYKSQGDRVADRFQDIQMHPQSLNPSNSATHPIATSHLPMQKDMKILGKIAYYIHKDSESILELDYHSLTIDSKGNFWSRPFVFENIYFGKFGVEGKISFIEGIVVWIEKYETGKKIFYEGKIDQVNNEVSGKWWLDLKSQKSQYFARTIIGLDNYKDLSKLQGVFDCKFYCNKLWGWHRDWLNWDRNDIATGDTIRSIFTEKNFDIEAIQQDDTFQRIIGKMNKVPSYPHKEPSTHL
jgi:hypothetical protein